MCNKLTLLTLYSVLHLLLICSNGLFEDEIGINDWARQNIGSTQLAAFVGQNVIIGTEQGVLASIDASNNGTLTWRSVLPLSDLNNDRFGEAPNGGFSFIAPTKKLVSCFGIVFTIFSNSFGIDSYHG